MSKKALSPASRVRMDRTSLNSSSKKVTRCTAWSGLRSGGARLKKFVRRDARMLRPSEPLQLVGNPAKAHRILGWKAETSLPELIRQMTHAELVELRELAGTAA
jgi:GDP-D-mannose dehydratase